MPPGVLFAVYDSQTGSPDYIPPEYMEIPNLLDELVEYVNTTDDHPLIIAAIVHYQLVTIHPFEDGNGRTARLLSGYILDINGYGFNGIGSLEEYFAYDAEEYYRQLRKVVDFIFHRKLQFKLKPIGRRRVIKEDNEKSNYCGSGVYMVTLGMDGKLYPCHRFATGRHRYDIGDIWHGFDKEKFKRFREGQDRINEQIGSTKLPLCYSANYDIDGTFDYHNNEEIMTEQEYRIYDYWMERMKEMSL